MSATRQAHVVVDDGKLLVDVTGSSGELVVCWPAGGRPGDDLAPLAEFIADTDRQVAVIHPRGCVGSPGRTEALSLHDLAADAAAVIEHLGVTPAVVLGHAFGNRVMRCLASDRPDLVAGVILLAAGGALPPENLDDLAILAAADVSRGQRINALRRAFFEPGSDPAVWLEPGGPDASQLYRTCVQPPLESWWHGGTAPMLVIQGGKDRSAVPGNGQQLADTFAGRVHLITIPDAAHALPIERPREIADHVISWLTRLAQRRASRSDGALSRAPNGDPTSESR